MATPSTRNTRHGTGSSDDEDIVLIATALLLDSSSSEEDVQPIPRGPRRPQRNFENCVGAIDGTHVDAWVAASREGRYRGRKTVKTWNVMAVCSFDGKFTFVYPRWEGSAHDSRVLAAAVADEVNNFPQPPAHKFYLVDAGYPNTTGFLAPYRGQRYHKDDFDGPNTVYESAMDLFNHRHAMLRNDIEKCFGVLKGRFKILKGMPNFDEIRQPLIVTACCVVHNWVIMQRGWDD